MISVAPRNAARLEGFGQLRPSERLPLYFGELADELPIPAVQVVADGLLLGVKSEAGADLPFGADDKLFGRHGPTTEIVVSRRGMRTRGLGAQIRAIEPLTSITGTTAASQSRRKGRYG
jgi:hypothetical protein